MSLQFHVAGQRITRCDHTYVVSGSRHFLTAEFTFNADWDGKIKTAILENGSTVYHIVLENDMISAERMPMLSAGVWKISVFAGDLMTADSVSIPVHPSGYREENAPDEPLPSVYESLTALIQDAIAKTEALGDKMSEYAKVSVDGETLIIQ